MSAGALLKTISQALARASPEALNLPKSGKGRQTLGEFYREYSKLSTHTLDISDATLKSQLEALVRSNPSLVDIIGKENVQDYVDASVKEFKSNILSFISKNTKKYSLESADEVKTTFSGDNYQQIRNLINAGFNTTSAYNIKDFLQKVLKNIGNSSDISNIDFGTKFGFDVGHYHSNIVSAYGAVIFNAVRRDKKVDISSDIVREEIDSLYSKLQDPSVAQELMGKLGITDEELFKACVSATVGFTKSIVDNKLDIILKTEPKLDSTVIRKIASQVLDKTFPEFSLQNQQKGSNLEKAISNHLSKATSGYFLQLMNEIAIGKHLDLLKQESSKPVLKLMEENFINLISGKGTKNITTKTTVTTKPTKRISIGSISPPKGSNNSTKKVPIPKLPTLRNLQGKFTSLTSLQTLMNQQLRATIIKNMKRPNLRNKTGRFASSVELKSLSRERDGAVSAFLTYMRYPYATFEREGKQGHKGYYPSRLIDQSVREIASKLVKERMRVTVQ